MTTPYEGEWIEEGESSEFEPNVAEAEYPAVVPVRVMFDETERLPPEFATMITWPVGTTGVTGSGPVQILQRRYKRFKAKFFIQFPGAGSVILNTKQEQLSGSPANPVGFTVTVAAAANNVPIPDYDGMPAMWAVATIAGCTISVMDESYGQVQ